MAKKTIKDRVIRESQEGYAVEQTGLPGTRFNETAQISTSPETKSTADLVEGHTAPGIEATTASAARTVKKKMSIRPTSEAELNAGKQVGGVPLGLTESVADVAGAQANSAVDQSVIPYSKGGYRPNTRYGKKITTDNFVINNTIAEQIIPEVEESKDLRQAPEALQGYNGVKQFKTARGKKNAGVVPASFLYDRSVDFIESGSVIHTTGQVLDNITAKAAYPTVTVDESGKTAQIEHPMKKANYLLNSFKFDIVDGHIANPRFEEIEIVSPIQLAEAEAANQNWQIDANNVAQTMVKLQTELGRETTEKWSPLGYVIDQPYEYNMLMHDIEATTGSLMAGAYRSAAHSLAYHINKLGKDGAKGVTPIFEMMDVNTTLTSDAYESLGEDVETIVFNKDVLKKGSPAAIIAMFDSVKKYTTKADFFNQQRSFKFHLQNVDNNINPLHCKREFLKVMDKEHVFSTEDGLYNPMLPIHITSDLKIMNPLSLNYFLQGWLNPHIQNVGNLDAGTKNVYAYQYQDIRFKYNWGVRHPLVDGLLRWMLRHESNLVRAYGANAEGIEWPVNMSNTKLNMFCLALCSAAQDVLWMRNVIFRDAIFAGEQEHYLWDDLVSLKEFSPVTATQYTYSDYGSALKLGKLSVDKALRLYWPETIGYRADVNPGAGTNGVSYILPWYFNENAIGEAQDGYGYSTGIQPHCMSMPAVRGGVNHYAVDLLYSVDERDLRLALDRMVTVPYTTSIIAKGDKIYASSDTYKADSVCVVGRAGTEVYNISNDNIDVLNEVKFAALRYDKVSDGRVIMIPGRSTANPDNEHLCEVTYLVTPRELGFVFTMPSAMKKVSNSYFGDPLGDTSFVNKQIDGSSVYSLTCYQAYGEELNETTVSRTASLKQRWSKVFAKRAEAIVAHNIALINKLGIVPAVGAFIDGADGNATPTLDVQVVSKDCIYQLNSANLITDELQSKRMISLMSFMWTIIQRLYLPINPFEVAYEANTSAYTAKPSSAPIVDPFEVAFYFGCCGCLASDYNQDILERLNIKDELGMYYTEDEFIKSSLIFR